MDYLTLIPPMIGTLSIIAFTTYLAINMSKTPFFRARRILGSLIFGAAFGLIAIYATNYAIPFQTALINMRDVAPLAAGLIFGPVAGILAGLIGALERLSHNGLTTVPCSISTLLAGIIAAILYVKFRKPIRPVVGLIIAVLMEAIHITLALLIPIGKDTTGFISVPIPTLISIIAMITLPTMISHALGLYVALAIRRKEGMWDDHESSM